MLTSHLEELLVPNPSVFSIIKPTLGIAVLYWTCDSLHISVHRCALHSFHELITFATVKFKPQCSKFKPQCSKDKRVQRIKTHIIKFKVQTSKFKVQSSKFKVKEESNKSCPTLLYIIYLRWNLIEDPSLWVVEQG